MKNFEWDNNECRLAKYQRIKKNGNYESLSPDPSCRKFSFQSHLLNNIRGENEEKVTSNMKSKLKQLLIQEQIKKKKSEIKGIIKRRRN